MNKLSQVLIFFSFILLCNCSNNYDKMLKWAENIPVGTDIEEIKKSQPRFVLIDWKTPIDWEENGKYSYYFIRSKNYEDEFPQYFLVFDKNQKFEETRYLK